jgi:hypothetical protein
MSVSRCLTLPTQPLPTGPRCHPAPLVSRRAHVARAPPPSTVVWQRHRPRPLVGGRCQPPEPSPTAPGPPLSFPFPASMWHPNPNPPASLFSPLLRARARSKATDHRPVPLFTPLLYTRAQAHRCLSRPPLTRSTDHGRQDHCGPRHVSERSHPPPPHGETRQSATISLFGAALTSPVLPRSSRS